MQILENFSLKNHNTFGIAAKAKFFVEINTISELEAILQDKNYPNKLILGGGSNILIIQDIDALVIYINLKGIEVLSKNDDKVIIKVMAGENWHDMVLWTLNHNFGGLENMSLIPGNTGTAPIQNIGAYGIELKDSFVSCEAIQVETQTGRTFSKEDCNFGYRQSYFKNEGKNKFVITSVSLELSTKNHKLNTSYGAIEQELTKMGILNPTIKDVSNAVIAIRKSKLPDPNELGNSGSFFKNPIITYIDFESFTKKNPSAPYYKVSEEEYKIPAGWLIDQSGFKGKRYGDAGVHKNQALVLVNYGNATGKEILKLAEEIIKEVKSKFDISLTPEVNLIR